MILTDRQIRETCEREDIVISPFDLSQIQPASDDFRVGEQGMTTSSKNLTNIKDVATSLFNLATLQS